MGLSVRPRVRSIEEAVMIWGIGEAPYPIGVRGVRNVCGTWIMRGFSLVRVFMRTARGALAKRGVLGVFGVFGVLTAFGMFGV